MEEERYDQASSKFFLVGAYILIALTSFAIGMYVSPFAKTSAPVVEPTTTKIIYVHDSATTTTPVAAATPVPQAPALSKDCPKGYVRKNGECLFMGCPAGAEISQGVCVKAAPRCDVSTYCSGNDVWHTESSCAKSRANTCEYGCLDGLCKNPPRAEGVITAEPSSAAKGQTVRISWTSKNVLPNSCSVSELSPLIDDSAKGDSGSFTSSPIQETTPYVLSCTELSGAIYNIFTKVTLQ